MKTKFFSLLIIIVLFFAVAKPASAFGIMPVKILLTVNPSSSQTVVVKIKNDEKKDLTFKLGVTGVKQDEQGAPVFAAGTETAESWVYPENDLVSIKSGETKSVNFIVKVPADAASGSHYLGLTVEPSLSASNQTGLKTKLVSLLTLQVGGLVNESVIINKWTLIKNSLKNWQFDLSLQNYGSMEVMLRGMATVKNWRGDEIFSQPIILGNKLLAGSKRVLHPEIILQDNINLPGLYQAQIKIDYGRTNQVVSSIAYVWYFPMWSKIILIIGALLLILVVIFIVKRPKRVKV